VEEDVGWGEIAVHDAEFMHLLDGHEHLPHQGPGFLLSKVSFSLGSQGSLKTRNSWCSD